MELIELVIIFLGASPKDTYNFRTPGAMHHARFMSKALYSLKIFIFRNEFKLTKTEENGLRRVCIFLVRFYVKWWLTASVSVMSPYNDLIFVQNMIEYKEEDELIASSALTKISNHLWYLSDEAVGLALFDPNISDEIKKKIVFAIKNNINPNTPVKKVEFNINLNHEVELWKNREIQDFVSQHTQKLFTRFNLNTNFLDLDPSVWKTNQHYQRALQLFKSLKVVNDSAERAVALVTKFNSCITKNEEQKQYLYHVVQNHRKMYPNTNKSSLCK